MHGEPGDGVERPVAELTLVLAAVEPFARRVHKVDLAARNKYFPHKNSGSPVGFDPPIKIRIRS